MAAWKAFERESAALLGGARFWANSGERSDFEARVNGVPVLGQCKLVKTLSLESLTKLAEENDVVCVKVRRGRGQKSQPLLVMTFETYTRLFGKTACRFGTKPAGEKEETIETGAML